MVATEMSDCLLVFDQVGMGWFLSWALGGEGGHVCGSWRCRDGGRGSVSVGRTQLVHVEVGDHLTRDFSQHRLGQSFFRRISTKYWAEAGTHRAEADGAEGWDSGSWGGFSLCILK